MLCKDYIDHLIPDNRFKYAVSIVLEHEGGLEKQIKRDPGSVTKWGISLRFLRSIGYDFNHSGAVDSEDILALSMQDAEKIYKEYWWDKYHYEAINSLIVATKIFDMSINMGSYQAQKLAQIAVNRLQQKPIAVDGKLGPQTIAAINSQKENPMMVELRACAEHYYIELIANNPAMAIYKDGWLRRAEW